MKRTLVSLSIVLVVIALIARRDTARPRAARDALAPKPAWSARRPHTAALTAADRAAGYLPASEAGPPPDLVETPPVPPPVPPPDPRADVLVHHNPNGVDGSRPSRPIPGLH